MKYIKDYPADGTVGIQCKSEEEWLEICDLLDAPENHSIRKKYSICKWDTIGVYKSGIYGWSAANTYKIVLQAADFLEITLKKMYSYEIY